MQEIYQAVLTVFNAMPHHDFYTNIAGELHAGKVPGATNMPYAAVTLPIDEAVQTFDNSKNKIEMHFEISADTISEAHNLKADLREVYDDIELTITGYKCHPLTLVQSVENVYDTYFSCIVQYSIEIEKV